MRRRIASLLTTLGLLLLLPAPAQAAFHLVSIGEIRAATSAVPFVELQMYSPGQTQLAGHSLTTYTSTGVVIDAFPLASVANGENQRTILIAPGAIGGVSPDITHSLGFSGPGGAVCFETIDCVSYGTFSGSLPSPAGSPVAGYPAADGSLSITRSIAAGCPTLLESSDDTNDSAADFKITSPTPRNNATAPTEVPCSGPGPGGGDNKAPDTEITKGPRKRSSKRTASFKFESTEAGSSFACKLDKRAFKSCSSPFKAKVTVGKHRFQVRATDNAGNTDPTPATDNFKRIPPPPLTPSGI